MPTGLQVQGDHPVQNREDLLSALIETDIPVDVGDLEHPPPREVVKKRERERAVETWNEAVELYEEEGEAAFEQHLDRKEERAAGLSAKVGELEDRLHEKRLTRDMAAERVQDGEEDEALGQDARDLPGPTPNAYSNAETWGEVLTRAREECWEYEEKLNASRGRLQEARFKRDALQLFRALYEQGYTPKRVGIAGYEPSDGVRKVLSTIDDLIDSPLAIEEESDYLRDVYRFVNRKLNRDGDPDDIGDLLRKDLKRKGYDNLFPNTPKELFGLVQAWTSRHETTRVAP